MNSYTIRVARMDGLNYAVIAEVISLHGTVPARESGVHHFHRLLAQTCAE